MRKSAKVLLCIALPLMIVSAVATVAMTKTQPATSPVTAGKANPAPTAALPPAQNLRVRVAQQAVDPQVLLDPFALVWQTATATNVLLNHSPRLYQTEQPAWNRPVPRCQLRAIRAYDRLYVNLRWDDDRADTPQAPLAKTGQGGGDPAVLYKRPTAHPDAFPDAAAIMIPDAWTGPALPSIVMGDAAHAVMLYYWNASGSVAVLAANGRVTPRPIPDATFAHRAVYRDGAWWLVMELPNQPVGYPLAVAVWDGRLGQRDGLKSFSIWYVLSDVSPTGEAEATGAVSTTVSTNATARTESPQTDRESTTRPVVAGP